MLHTARSRKSKRLFTSCNDRHTKKDIFRMKLKHIFLVLSSPGYFMLILYGTDIKFHENVLIHRKNQLSNFIHTLLSLRQDMAGI